VTAPAKSLKLYFHPLSSFCHKALIALYENDTVFEPVQVDFGDAASRSAFEAVWPMKKMPVLRDEMRGCTVAEATIVIEYLDTHYPGGTRFLPADADRAWQTRMWDRVFDHYIHYPMQQIVGDRLRPAGKSDAYGVDEAKARIRSAYALVEQHLDGKTWMMGGDFTLADCAAAPALFYANVVLPIDGAHNNLRAYLDRLFGRASYARVLREAAPYFSMFPMERKPRLPQGVSG
jgi:glutathione S-transferase